MPPKVKFLQKLLKAQGLISLKSKFDIKDKWGLSMLYTPGVGKCCKVIRDNKEEVYNLTSIENNIFIMSNGSLFHKDYLLHKPSFMLPKLELASFCYKAQNNINAYPLVFDSNIIKTDDDVVSLLGSLVPSTAAVELYEVDSLFYKNKREELDKLELVIILPENRDFLLSLHKGFIFNKAKTNKALYHTNLIIGCLVKVLTQARIWGTINNDKLKQIYNDCRKYFKDTNEFSLKQNIIESIVKVYGIDNIDSTEFIMKTIVDFMDDKDKKELFYRQFKTFSSDENSLFLHRILKGVVATTPNVPISDLKLFLSPNELQNVKEICWMIYKKPELDLVYTMKKNYCAIITDGSAILGYGNIGPRAGMPVMEGKACLFKQLGDTNVLSLGLLTNSTEETVKIIRGMADSWVGINLEDISAPSCFEIEKTLKELLPIPVFHDDQHGTAIVVLAGLINAIKVAGKKKEQIKIVMNGAGAAGRAVMDLLYEFGFKDIIMIDRKGAIYEGRPDIKETHYKSEIAKKTNRDKQEGNLEEVIKGKDVFIGVSAPNVLSKGMVRTMNKDPIVFALANPDPEIHPDEAIEGGAFIVATGRSDFNNQINNSLAFPGIFKGLIDAKSNMIDMDTKLTAAIALSMAVPDRELNRNFLLPYSLDLDVAKIIAQSILKKEDKWIDKVKL